MTSRQELQDYLTLLHQRPLAYTTDEVLEPVEDIDLLEAYSRENQVKLGIVYQSARHIYVVDLVRNKAGKLFPYERLLKAVTGSSVVIVPFREEKLVLLKQFRHALGDYQYCFPRGFAEAGILPAENAQKEISEELNCHSWNFRLLGQVVADSGICGEKVWVYRCAVEVPSVDVLYENIATYIEVTIEELAQMIRTGQINDGFTLSAAALLGTDTRP